MKILNRKGGDYRDQVIPRSEGTVVDNPGIPTEFGPRLTDGEKREVGCPTLTGPRPAADPREILPGLYPLARKIAAEIKDDTGVAVRWESGIRLTPTGRTTFDQGLNMRAEFGSEPVLGGSPTTAGFVIKVSVMVGMTLIPRDRLERFAEVFAKLGALDAKIEQFGFTTDHKRRIVAADEQRRGSEGYRGLINDPDAVWAIVSGIVRGHKAEKRALNASVTDDFLATALTMRSAMQTSLVASLGREMREAAQYELDYVPSSIVSSLDRALADLAPQIKSLEAGNPVIDLTSALFGVPKRLVDDYLATKG
jgi:hypothetical protein